MCAARRLQSHPVMKLPASEDNPIKDVLSPNGDAVGPVHARGWHPVLGMVRGWLLHRVSCNEGRCAVHVDFTAPAARFADFCAPGIDRFPEPREATLTHGENEDTDALLQ